MRFNVITAAIGIVLMLAIGASAGPLVTGDLTAHYDFSNYVGGDGSIVTDGSGNSYDGTIVGDLVQEVGPNGGAARFWTEGTSVVGTDWNFVDLPVDDIFAGGDIPTSNFTLAAWYYTKQALGTGPGNSDQAILCPRGTGPSWLLHPELRGRTTETEDYYRFTLRGDLQADSIGTVEAGRGFAEGPNWEEWTHIAFTWDKSTTTMKVYENGSVIGQFLSATPIDMSSNWGLGARIGVNVDDARQFLGIMDEVYIFSRTLSAAEVGTLAGSSTIPGDANSDGSVDVSDLGLLATNYGSSENGWADGDFTGDGLVDVSDLGVLSTNYGAGTASAVPEPSTLVLLALGTLALVLRRRK